MCPVQFTHDSSVRAQRRVNAGCVNDPKQRTGELTHEPFNAMVAAGEAVIFDQILPDSLGVAAAPEGLCDAGAEGFADAGAGFD